MIRISRETIGGNIRHDDDAQDINEHIDIEECEGEECMLPEWAAEDQ